MAIHADVVGRTHRHGVAPGAEAAPIEAADRPFGLPVLEQLTKLIGVDHACASKSYSMYPTRVGPSSVEYPVIVYPACYCDRQLFNLNPLREESVGDSETPRTLSDFLTPRTRRRNPFFPRGAAARRS